MSVFADTSFLFSFYFPRADSERAIAWVESASRLPRISPLVRYEFIQAIWFKVWLSEQGQPLGLNQTVAQSVLAAFELDIEQGLWTVEPMNWEMVIQRAETLTIAHTPRHGARAMDIIHLATALELRDAVFLSFDVNQRRIASAEGLQILP